MNISKLKPIPKYIEKKIRAKDLKECPLQKGLRFYSYLTKIENELVKVSVAMRNKGKQPAFIKQVAVHGVDSDKCYVRDMEYCYLGVYTYRVGWYEEGIKSSKGRAFYNDGIWYDAPWTYYNPYTNVINPEYALKHTKYRYSAIDVYNPICPITYLKTYTKYPQIEYLAKLGYKKLAMSKQILNKVGKDKNFRKWLSKNKDVLGGHSRYYVEVVLRAYSKGTNLDIEQERAEIIKRHRTGHFKTFMNRFGNDEKMKLIDYVIRQNTNMYSYIDYYNACAYLELDMNDTKHRYPIDFKRWHDVRIDEYKTKLAMEDEERRKQFYLNFANVAEKFLPLERKLNEDFVVIIAKSPSELIEEGRILEHCVGKMNYDQKFVREESLIFFVRQNVDISTPFVTMEYSIKKKQILQCYGYKDQKPEQKVLDFVNKKWLPYAKKQFKALVA